MKVAASAFAPKLSDRVQEGNYRVQWVMAGMVGSTPDIEQSKQLKMSCCAKLVCAHH